MPIDWETGLASEWGVDADTMACGVPRVPLVEPGTESEELRPLYEQTVEMWGNVPRYIQLMAHVPAGVEAWNLLDREVRLKRLAERPDYVRLQELVIIKTSILNACNNCTGHNIDLGRALGLTEEQIDLVVGDGWRDSDLFDDRDKAVIGWAEAVTERTANRDDAAFEAMKMHFDDTEIVELTLICAMWNLSNRFAEALHLVVEPRGERITFQPADLGQPASSPA